MNYKQQDHKIVFQGTWFRKNDGKLLGSIHNDILTWENGAKNKLTYDEKGETMTVLDYQGEKWTAKLISTGLIEWNDGSYWTRQIPGKFMM